MQTDKICQLISMQNYNQTINKLKCLLKYCTYNAKSTQAVQAKNADMYAIMFIITVELTKMLKTVPTD